MTLCGTPAWTAPEVAKRERYTEQADVCSLGMVMWGGYPQAALRRREPGQGSDGRDRGQAPSGTLQRAQDLREPHDGLLAPQGPQATHRRARVSRHRELDGQPRSNSHLHMLTTACYHLHHRP